MRNFARDNRKLIPISAGGGAIAGAAIGGAASLLGGASANAASAKEAKLNREFQERMARNKHQYEVKDLRAAGLNPILSAHAGAAVPSGSAATQKNIVPENASGQITSALMAKKQLAHLDEQIVATRNQGIAWDTAAAKSHMETRLIQLGIPAAQNKANAEQGPLGMALTYGDRIAPYIASAGQLFNVLKILKIPNQGILKPALSNPANRGY